MALVSEARSGEQIRLLNLLKGGGYDALVRRRYGEDNRCLLGRSQ